MTTSQSDVLSMQALRRLVAAFAAASVLLMGAQAQAQAPNQDEQARTHFDSGNLHFDRGSYEEAKLEFEAAFRLSGRRALLYNVFISAERLGEFAEAVAYLEDYLEDGCPEGEIASRPRLA
ncbi:MAG: tetratricopeptide (TPR) repeat protein [Polyangiales bacterium]|jgi:tetratricopeptide (TPR) repeat protein